MRAQRCLVVAGLASVLMTTLPASAAWIDQATVSGSTITAYRVPVTTLRCGALGVLSVTFTWDAVAGATNYTLRYGTNGSQSVTVTGTSRTITSAISGGTAWVVVNRSFGSTTWSSAASNTRSYTVAAVSLCS